MRVDRKSNVSPLPDEGEMTVITDHYINYPECGGAEIIEKHKLSTGDFYLTCGECGRSV
jgi:hypothetical protein